MTARPAPSVRSPRRIAVLGAAVASVFVAGALGARPAAADSALHALPAVDVIQLAPATSSSGTVVLRNDGLIGIDVSRIVAGPGCDPGAVSAAPLTGFSLAPGAGRFIAISCAPAPASMQRCTYRALSSSNATLVEFEAVCDYAIAGGLTADAGAIDFGTLPVGGSGSRTIALHNAGSEPIDRLFVETTDPAGNFAVAAPCNPDARECDATIPVLAAGATMSVVVTCTPHSAGPHGAALYLTSGAGTRLAAPISLACTATAATAPVLAVVPGAIQVGSVEVVAATATATVHVTNAGVGSLKILAIQLVDAGTGGAIDWAVTPRAPCSAATPTCVLSDGQTADLDLVFDPSVIGARDATLLINYRDTADRSISIPLHGAGSGPTLDLVGAPATLDFGTLPVGVTGALRIAVTNRGTRTLSDAMATVTPAGAPFAVSPGPSFTVTTTAATQLTVSCTPAAAGTFSADLQLSAPDLQTAPIDLRLRCAGDPAQMLTATPPAILLGEVRGGSPALAHVAIASQGAPVALASATLVTAIDGLAVTGAPATTPVTLDLTASPVQEGSLDDHITVASDTGSALDIPVTGAAVAASYSAPAAVSLGTFCVQQPTTARIVTLSSTGSATIGLSAPALELADSPFDLARVAPLAYPNALAPGERASVALTPKRRSVAGLASDDLIWQTDVAGAATSHTTLTAMFIDDGGAIAPGALAFGQTPIHVDARNAQQVTLQNCSGSLLELDTPLVPAPFSIDSPFPGALNPGEIATFSIGFHPTKLGRVEKTLTITSPQLTEPLPPIELSGEGVAPSGGDDAGPLAAGLSSTSFYACGGCTTSDPSGALAIVLAALAILAPRRRHRRAR